MTFWQIQGCVPKQRFGQLSLRYDGIALRYDGIVSRGFDTVLSEKSLLFLGVWYFMVRGWYFMGCEGFVV